MKKTYITPAVDITKEEIEDVLFTNSVQYGGQGSDKQPVESKESSFFDFDNESSESNNNSSVNFEVNTDIFQ